MSLGGDAVSSKAAFVEAMRVRLQAIEEAEEAEEGTFSDNVDKPEVKPNLEALGQAVYNILTENAETVALAPTNPDSQSIWTWLQDVSNWLQELHTWQQDVSAELGLDPLESPPTNVPTELRGRIE